MVGRALPTNRIVVLQIPAQRLFLLDADEQCLEVADSEAAAAVPFYDLEEEGRSVLHRLGEDLEQVPVLVLVDEDAQLVELVPVLADVADALLAVEAERMEAGFEPPEIRKATELSEMRRAVNEV